MECPDQPLNGDVLHFAEALEAFRPYLLLIADRMIEADLRAKGSPSDLVQDTFLAAHRDRGCFHGERPDELKAWLSAILRVQVARLRRSFRGTASRSISREVALNGVEVPERVGPPLEDLQRGEEMEAIAALLRDLPESQRRIVEGRVEGGETFGHIGKRLGMTEDAVRMAWTRALKQLRGWLDLSAHLTRKSRHVPKRSDGDRLQGPTGSP
jgi:RNA polymerase sigma-70 factor (ECF subfamily)